MKSSRQNHGVSLESVYNQPSCANECVAFDRWTKLHYLPDGFSHVLLGKIARVSDAIALCRCIQFTASLQLLTISASASVQPLSRTRSCLLFSLRVSCVAWPGGQQDKGVVGGQAGRWFCLGRLAGKMSFFSFLSAYLGLCNVKWKLWRCLDDYCTVRL